MTDKKPTGVLMQLPIPEVAAWKIRTALDTPSYEPERLYAAFLAIGTPMNGNELACAGSVKRYASDPDPIVETCVPSAFENGASVSIVSLSDAQALIAARDAEIVGLQEHLSKITGAHLRLLTKRLVAEIDEEELARLQEENKRLKCKLKPQFFCSDILEESSMNTREDLVEEARGYGDDLQAFSVFKMEGYAKTQTSHGFFDKDIKCHWFDTEQEALDAAKALKGGAA